MVDQGSKEASPRAAADQAKTYAELPSLQDYWKTYAGWLACWPSVAEARSNINAFTEAWRQRGGASGDITAYVVTWTSPIKVRLGPSFGGEDDTTDQVVSPGQCLAIDRVEQKGSVNFLRLADGRGWVFDKVEGCSVIAKPTEIECGTWWYTVVCEDFVEVRSAPVYGDEYRNGWIMCPKELVQVSARCVIKGRRHCQLTDGRGWMFEAKPSSGRDETLILRPLNMGQQDDINARMRVTVKQQASFTPDQIFKRNVSERRRGSRAKARSGSAMLRPLRAMFSRMRGQQARASQSG
mmetsp:Transcript_61047/g.108647  ORF Transcript_61047/g.108647 Transcript_61047/m.108647 type:complete len:295 (+) Transcript_61047:167-1051(+)